MQDTGELRNSPQYLRKKERREKESEDIKRAKKLVVQLINRFTGDLDPNIKEKILESKITVLEHYTRERFWHFFLQNLQKHHKNLGALDALKKETKQKDIIERSQVATILDAIQAAGKEVAQELEIAKLAIDPLTELPMRRKFVESLQALSKPQQEESKADEENPFDEEKGKKEYALIVTIDVDKLNVVNNKYSHADGDRYLEGIGKSFGREVRGNFQYDAKLFAFRNGTSGDEMFFIVTCKAHNAQDAKKILMGRAMEALSEATASDLRVKTLNGTERIPCSVSAGALFIPTSEIESFSSGKIPGVDRVMQISDQLAHAAKLTTGGARNVPEQLEDSRIATTITQEQQRTKTITRGEGHWAFTVYDGSADVSDTAMPETYVEWSTEQFRNIHKDDLYGYKV